MDYKFVCKPSVSNDMKSVCNISLLASMIIIQAVATITTQ